MQIRLQMVSERIANSTLVRSASKFVFGLLLMCGLNVTFAQTTPHPLLPMCAACHGATGNSTVPGIPSLAGQPKIFLENQLVLIREGVRPIPAMQGMLDKVSDEDITLFAKYFAQLPVAPSQATVDAQIFKRGALLSKQGLCASCHMPDYVGREQMPRLAGQREDFLLSNMKQFRDGKAAGRDTMMSSVLRGMTDSQLSDLAHYFAVTLPDKKN